MGCDIHCYIEYREKDQEHWMSFGSKINPGRHYGIFAVLANVRNYQEGLEVLSPRGLPEDIGYAAESDSQLYIVDNETDAEEYCSREQAERWVREGSSEYTDERKEFVTHPDWHSHSYVTTKKLEDALTTLKKYAEGNGETIGHDFAIEYYAIVATMKELEKHGEARMVFWFDN